MLDVSAIPRLRCTASGAQFGAPSYTPMTTANINGSDPAYWSATSVSPLESSDDETYPVAAAPLLRARARFGGVAFSDDEDSDDHSVSTSVNDQLANSETSIAVAVDSGDALSEFSEDEDGRVQDVQVNARDVIPEDVTEDMGGDGYLANGLEVASVTAEADARSDGGSEFSFVDANMDVDDALPRLHAVADLTENSSHPADRLPERVVDYAYEIRGLGGVCRETRFRVLDSIYGDPQPQGPRPLAQVDEARSFGGRGLTSFVTTAAGMKALFHVVCHVDKPGFINVKDHTKARKAPTLRVTPLRYVDCIALNFLHRVFSDNRATYKFLDSITFSWGAPQIKGSDDHPFFPHFFDYVNAPTNAEFPHSADVTSLILNDIVDIEFVVRKSRPARTRPYHLYFEMLKVVRLGRAGDGA